MYRNGYFISPACLAYYFISLQATLRRIDLTGNMIQDIEDGAFSKLLLLEELSLAENFIKKLPVLPPKLTSLNANQNKITSRGIKANTFKVTEPMTVNDIQDSNLIL